MIHFIIGGFIMWLTCWIGFELCKYGYNLKIRPYMNDFIYKVEAIYEYKKNRIEVKAKELKNRDNPIIVEIEPTNMTRFEWSVRYGTKHKETVYTTEIVDSVSS